MQQIKFSHPIPASCFDYLFPEHVIATVTARVDTHGRVYDLSIAIPLLYLPVIGDRWTLQQEIQEVAEKIAHEKYMVGELIEAA